MISSGESVSQVALMQVFSPVAKVDISGNIKISDGSQGVGKVLT
jgi:hypothetical protein